jgi:hypothetical protein
MMKHGNRFLCKGKKLAKKTTIKANLDCRSMSIALQENSSVYSSVMGRYNLMIDHTNITLSDAASSVHIIPICWQIFPMSNYQIIYPFD